MEKEIDSVEELLRMIASDEMKDGAIRIAKKMAKLFEGRNHLQILLALAMIIHELSKDSPDPQIYIGQLNGFINSMEEQLA